MIVVRAQAISCKMTYRGSIFAFGHRIGDFTVEAHSRPAEFWLQNGGSRAALRTLIERSTSGPYDRKAAVQQNDCPVRPPSPTSPGKTAPAAQARTPPANLQSPARVSSPLW